LNVFNRFEYNLYDLQISIAYSDIIKSPLEHSHAVKEYKVNFVNSGFGKDVCNLNLGIDDKQKRYDTLTFSRNGVFNQKIIFYSIGVGMWDMETEITDKDGLLLFKGKSALDVIDSKK
jgi:hypothetical protein